MSDSLRAISAAWSRRTSFCKQQMASCHLTHMSKGMFSLSELENLIRYLYCSLYVHWTMYRPDPQRFQKELRIPQV